MANRNQLRYIRNGPHHSTINPTQYAIQADEEAAKEAIERMTVSGIMTSLRGAKSLSAAVLLRGFAGLLLALPHARAQDQALGSATSTDGKVRLEILSLKRTEGDTVTLRWQIMNNGNDSYGMTPSNIHLVDIPGRRVYSPGLTSPNCSTPAGQRMTCYAVFGALPAATKTMTVQFYEKIELISGVPVSE